MADLAAEAVVETEAGEDVAAAVVGPGRTRRRNGSLSPNSAVLFVQARSSQWRYRNANAAMADEQEIYLHSLPIKEYQIVDQFLPKLKDEVMKVARPTLLLVCLLWTGVDR